MGITPKNPADFDPTMKDYHNLSPFRMWCQKVLPIAYDDSLSYYEVLCKLTDYINKVIEDMGLMEDNIDALHTAFLQLQSYVNDYFSTLDVQTEINNKLDSMVEDGTLDAILLPYFNAYKTEINGIVATQNQNIENFKSQINTTVNQQNATIATQNDRIAAQNNAIAQQDSDILVLEGRMDSFTHLAEGSTTGDAELIDIRTGANGVTYPSAGDAVRGQYNQLHTVDMDSATELGLFTQKTGVYSTFAQIRLPSLSTSKRYYIRVLNNSVPTNALVTYIDDSGTAVLPNIVTGTRYEFTPVNGSAPLLVVRYSAAPATEPYLTYEFGEVGATLLDRFNSLLPIEDGIKVDGYQYNIETYPSDWKNCDNLPINSVVGLKFTWDSDDGFTNFPVENFQGDILTVNTVKSNVSHGFQIAMAEAYSDGSTTIYFRRRYSTWGEWRTITSSKDLIGVDTYHWSSQTYPANWKDCDNLPINYVVGIKFAWSSSDGFTHYPIENFQGDILTINTIKDNATHGFQIAMSEAYSDGDTKIYYRRRYVNWGEWKTIEIGGGSANFNGTGAYRGLGSFTVCGDSLSVSLAYKDASTSKTVKSWATTLAEMMSSQCNIYAQGGLTTGGFLNSSLYQSAISDEKDFAIIFLGTNDANQSVSEADFKSNYTSIINGLLTNHKFVLCLNLPPSTSPASGSTYSGYIEDVCDNIEDAFVVDVASFDSDFGSLKGWGHLSSVGYSALAESVSKAVDITIRDNNYFKVDVDF